MNKKSKVLLNYEKYYYIDEGTSDDVLLFVHGNLSSSMHYKPLIEEYRKTYRTITPDLRGFGDSSYNTPIKSLEDLSDDLILLLDSLNIKTFTIFGWSTGGAIALKLAAKYPSYVKKIVLIESASYRGYPVYKKDVTGNPIVGEFYLSKEELALDPVNVLPIKLALENNDYNFMKYIWDALIYNQGTHNLEDYDMLLKESLKQRNIVDIDWALTAFNMSNFTNGVTMGDNTIKDVRVPVLSIWSEFDIVVLEYMVDETVEALENVTKVVIKGTGHSPIDTKTSTLISSINKFLY